MLPVVGTGMAVQRSLRIMPHWRLRNLAFDRTIFKVLSPTQFSEVTRVNFGSRAK